MQEEASKHPTTAWLTARLTQAAESRPVHQAAAHRTNQTSSLKSQALVSEASGCINGMKLKHEDSDEKSGDVSPALSEQGDVETQTELLAVKWLNELSVLPVFMLEQQKEQKILRPELPAEIGLTVLLLLNFKELKLTTSLVCKSWAVLAAEVERTKNNATDKAHGWDDAWCQYHLAFNYKLDTAKAKKLQSTRSWTARDIYYNYPWAQAWRVDMWRTVKFDYYNGSVYRCKLKNIEQCVFYLSVSTLYKPQNGMNNLLPQFSILEWKSKKSDHSILLHACYETVDEFRKDPEYFNPPRLPIYKVRLKSASQIKVSENAFRLMTKSSLYVEDVQAKIADVAHIELLEPKQSLSNSPS